MPETPALDAIDSAVERLMDALERIAAEHGSEAVDLAMTAYQVDSVGYVIGWVLLGVASLGLFGACVVGFILGAQRDTTDEYAMFLFLAFVTAAAAAGVIGNALTNVPTILAAFGSPEILVATNVLKSAGLM